MDTFKFSKIGLGTWAIGGGDWKYGWGHQDEKDSIETINTALNNGINWIDTAPIYGLGRAEEVIAKAIYSLNEKPFIATKCGLSFHSPQNIYQDLRPKVIRKELESSLKRLNIERIDLYQIHWPKPINQITKAFNTLQELQKEGKINHLGVCNFSLKHLTMIDPLSLFSYQGPYNFLDRNMESTLFGWNKINKTKLLSYSPLCSGLLSDQFDTSRLQKLHLKDWRLKKSPYFRETNLKIHSQLIKAIKKTSSHLNRSVEEIAINWILHHQDINSVIVGARSKSQIQKSIKCLDWKLNPEEIKKLEVVFADYKKLMKSLKS